MKQTGLRRELALVTTGALFMTLSAPPVSWWPLAFVAWAPLALLAADGRVVRAGLLGWLQGTVAQSSALASVPAALHHVGGASWLGSAALAIALVAFEGGRFGAIAALTAAVARNGWPLRVALPAALVVAEWLYPMLFPWTTALFFHGLPVLLQGAELGGVPVVSLWAGAVHGSLAEAWLARDDRARWVRLALVIPGAVLGTVVVFGASRMRAIDAGTEHGSALSIGIVQGNAALAGARAVDSLPIYRRQSAELVERERVGLLVWPETAIDFPVAADDLSRVLGERVFRAPSRPAVGSAIDVPLLTGVVVERPPRGPPVRVWSPGDAQKSDPASQRFNAAILATPDGRIRGEYDKRHLVALGEDIPGEGTFPWLRRLAPSAGRFSAGSSSAPLVLEGKRLLVFICYEDILAEPVRAAVDEADPDLLVNLTSDAWFGESRVPTLHLALARLRAIEHRRYLVHATNTGVSAVVDPAGRIVAELPANRPASAVARVRLLRGRTVYEAIGDSPRYVVGAALIGLLLRRAKCRSNVTAGTSARGV